MVADWIRFQYNKKRKQGPGFKFVYNINLPHHKSNPILPPSHSRWPPFLYSLSHSRCQISIFGNKYLSPLSLLKQFNHFFHFTLSHSTTLYKFPCHFEWDGGSIFQEIFWNIMLGTQGGGIVLESFRLDFCISRIKH